MFRCGHCKRLAPEYEIVGSAFARFKKNVVVAKVDCDQHKELCARFDVKGYPTLNWFPKGETAKPTPYSGGRTANDIIQFINSKTGMSLSCLLLLLLLLIVVAVVPIACYLLLIVVAAACLFRFEGQGQEQRCPNCSC
jgi:protein disulfide-isomerase-like protein